MDGQRLNTLVFKSSSFVLCQAIGSLKYIGLATGDQQVYVCCVGEVAHDNFLNFFSHNRSASDWIHVR